MTQTILLGARLPGAPHRIIEDRYRILLPDGDIMPQDELDEHLQEADAVVALLSQKVGAAQFERAPNLKVVSNYAVGYDNIDVDEATRRGIVVTNTPDVLTETTADLAWSLMMAAARRIVESDRFVREKRFTGWQPSLMLGLDLFGKTLGIVGFGRIGRAMARRAAGFDMTVLYAARSSAHDDAAADGEPRLVANRDPRLVSLDSLLRESDFVSLHCPLTPATRHLIGAEQLRLMKDSAVLVNTARGPVIDETALIDALENHAIAAAGLDVYEQEPLVPDRFLALDNVVFAPHIGSASHDTRRAMARMAVDAAEQVLSGRTPDHPVNPSALKK